MNMPDLFTAEEGLRPANYARRRRALWSTLVAAVVAVVMVAADAWSPSWVLVAAAIVAGLETFLAWLARVVYGWRKVTPARMVAVRMVRLAPISLLAAGGVVLVFLAASGATHSVSIGLFALLAMMVASGAAGIAGATN